MLSLKLCHVHVIYVTLIFIEPFKAKIIGEYGAILF